MATSEAVVGSSCEILRSKRSWVSCIARPPCRSCRKRSNAFRVRAPHSERVMTSALYLAEHLAEVPAIVIPTIIGRHDGGGRPGLFDSVIQSAWSFCLALRARGLGTTWVTAALQNETRVKEILGIPSHMTEIVLLPVAWTKGTDFKPAPRRPAREITYFDRFGTTAESGPGESLSFDNGPGTIVETDIAASRAAVWALVTDIDLPARYSSEFLGATWENDERGVGAVFHGRNQHPAIGTWTVPCYIDAYDERRSFGWRTSRVDTPGARWRFELEQVGDKTRVCGSATSSALGARERAQRSTRTPTRSACTSPSYQ